VELWVGTASLGTALIVGGTGNAGSALTSVDIYDPASDTWSTTTPSLGTARHSRTGILLSNGMLLVTRGSPTAALSSEIYRAMSGTWTTTGSPRAKRAGHTATLLPKGAVMSSFGSAGEVLTEIYQ